MKRVGKLLLHLWHTDGHIGRREFTHKIIVFGLISFILNLILVLSFYQFDRTDSYRVATIILWVMLAVNLILVYRFSRLIGKRINDVRGHISVFSGFIYTLCTALPYAGLYLLVFLCRRQGRVTEQYHESKKEWTLLHHTLIALVLPFFLLFPLRYNFVQKNILDLQVPTGINLVYSFFYDSAEPLFRQMLRMSRSSLISGVILENCKEDLQTSCMDYSMISLKEDSSDVSSIILEVAANALQVFKRKDVHFYSADSAVNNFKAAFDLLSRDVELTKTFDLRKDQFESSWPYGVYLISGNIQIPLLELFDRSLREKYLSVSLPRLLSLHDDLKKMMVDIKFEHEKDYTQTKHDLEVLERELELLTNRYDYLLEKE